jgi:hypothetical protein
VGAVDSGIDFPELCDYIGNRELGEINHLGSSRVSREGYRQVTRSLETRFYFSAKFENNPISQSLQRPALHGSQLKAMKMVPLHHDR